MCETEYEALSSASTRDDEASSSSASVAQRPHTPPASEAHAGPMHSLPMSTVDGTPLPATPMPAGFSTDMYNPMLTPGSAGRPHAVPLSLSQASMMGWSPMMGGAVPMVMTMPGSASPMSVAFTGYAPSPGASTPSVPALTADMAALNMAPVSAAPTMMPVGRTVYVGNLPDNVPVNELLDLVHFGPLENVRLFPDKNCAFLSFLTAQTAASFHADSSVKRVTLRGQELKIGWGKPSVLPPSVLYAVQHHQASRNVYIGHLDDGETVESLRDKLLHFGPIDQVKIQHDQHIAFVHFLSIQTAMKVVSVLPADPDWSRHRINYGKDRCAYVPKGQQQIQAHNQQAAARGLATATWLGYPTGYVNYGPSPFSGDDEAQPDESGGTPRSQMSLGQVEPQLHQFGNRTVYLGNLHANTTAEDICNHVRGGILQSIRYLADRHIAFVTFVDHNAALTFYHMASVTGMTIHNRRPKVGWGKSTGPLSPGLALAVQAGASRNVYLGNIADPSLMDEQKIRADLSEYGELEMAFANFTNIQSAIKCIEGLKVGFV